MKLRHLYVHVPFCRRRCVYCDFSIAVRKVTPVAEFLEAITVELDQTLAATSIPTTLDTIYFGGGTPSRLGPEGIAALLEAVRMRARVPSDAEVTIEANPEDVSGISAREWRDAGINRVSLGAQSFDDSVLKWMHRNHSAADIRRAVDDLHAGGIDNISIDLIFALPEFLNRSWTTDLGSVIELDTPHVSIYGLTVEPRTPLARWTDSGAVPAGDDEKYAEEFLEADRRLTAADFDHYEVSNFARGGMISRHNSAYWTGADYLGVGPSAHSLIHGERRWNVAAYEAWRTRVMSGQSVIAGRETLNDGQRDLERVYLGLRTNRGYQSAAADLPTISRWLDSGWGSVNDGLLRLTPAGWLRLDSLAVSLAGTPHSGNYITGHGTPSP